MKRRLFYFLRPALFFALVFGMPLRNMAQTLERFVVSAAGEHVSGGAYEMNFTLGEAVAGSLENGGWITQGFQQSWLIITGVADETSQAWNVAVYPNPTSCFVHIEIPEAMHVRLLDISGRMLMENAMPQGNHDITLAPFPSGTYFLLLQKEQSQEPASFRIVKL